jgi:hypothetical protein
LFAVCLLPLLAAAAQPEGGLDEWKFDVLHLKNGNAVQGLILKETPAEVHFQNVRQNPGRPTVVITTTFPRKEIESIDHLDARERDVLAARIKALDAGGASERRQMRALELKPVPWGKDGRALQYTSDHFVLVSSAPEDIVRQAAVRLEQLYAAYGRFLPPRRPLARPTTILLVPSLAEYQALLRSQMRNILNPAFYDPDRNQIVCASDLQRLGEDLGRVRQQEEQLEKQVAELTKRYKGKIPAVLREQIARDQKEIAKVNDKNRKVFEAATARLFQTLYHEAFHAYLANFVYPPKEVEVPLWLNEGMAQVFETALVEAGELRVGHADRARLTRARSAAERGDLVPVAELLKAGPKQFHVNHASDQQLSDRYYLTSWALTFYLMFDQKILSTPRKLDQYMASLQRGTHPLEAFRELVGRPLPQFQAEFREYVRKLK